MKKRTRIRTKLRGRAIALATIFIFNLVAVVEASAAPEESQVYLDDFSEVGKTGLDLHINYVSAGQPPTYHQMRVTPELSYGINTHWEVATYWLTVKNPGSSPQTDGVKVRARYRPKAPSADSPFYWAVNFEVGQLSKRFYPDETSSEIKLIGVWKTDPWSLGVNLNLDRSLKSRPVQAATSEIDTRIAYQIREGLQLGVENYFSLGAIHNDPTQPQSNQANYLTADFMLGKWEVGAGIGHASGQITDKTVLKVVVGVPF